MTTKRPRREPSVWFVEFRPDDGRGEWLLILTTASRAKRYATELMDYWDAIDPHDQHRVAKYVRRTPTRAKGKR
jgi:hypothetical protein